MVSYNEWNVYIISESIRGDMKGHCTLVRFTALTCAK